MAKTYISTKVFVPAKQLDLAAVQRHYEFPYYQEDKCQKCPVYKAGERHSEQCEECPAYNGIVKLWQEKEIRGRQYIGLPPGQPAKLEHLFGINLDDAVDLRPELPLPAGIKFTYKLYDGSVVDGHRTTDQIKIAQQWWQHKFGIIQASPRSGKTSIAIHLMIRLGVRTIIVANKKTLLRQFYDTIMGSKLRKPATNIRKLERHTGRKIVGIVEKMSDFKDLAIALVPYQKFIRNKDSIARIAKYINNNYGLLILDECHRSGASAYLKFVSRLNCKYRLALSATPLRKDGRDRLAREYLGNIVAKSNVTAKIPKLELVETGVWVKHNYKTWVYGMKHLASHKERNQLIVRDVFRDLRAGHHSIIIPVDFVAHGNLLLNMINRQAHINNQKRKEAWPEPIATFLTNATRKSQQQLDRMLDDVDTGKYRVLIAIRSKINEGIDLRNPTMLYNIIPTSASKYSGGGLFYQLSQRISTWHKDKMQPIVRLYLDGMSQSFGCLRSLFFFEILPGIKAKPPKYLIDQHDYERIMQIVRNKTYEPINSPSERLTSKDLLGKQLGNQLEQPRRGFSAFR